MLFLRGRRKEKKKKKTLLEESEQLRGCARPWQRPRETTKLARKCAVSNKKCDDGYYYTFMEQQKCAKFKNARISRRVCRDWYLLVFLRDSARCCQRLTWRQLALAAVWTRGRPCPCPRHGTRVPRGDRSSPTAGRGCLPGPAGSFCSRSKGKHSFEFSKQGMCFPTQRSQGSDFAPYIYF